MSGLDPPSLSEIFFEMVAVLVAVVVEDRVILVSTFLLSMVLVVVLEIVFVALSSSLPEVLILDSVLVSFFSSSLLSSSFHRSFRNFFFSASR